jgi:hypothetical protein
MFCWVYGLLPTILFILRTGFVVPQTKKTELIVKGKATVVDVVIAEEACD